MTDREKHLMERLRIATHEAVAIRKKLSNAQAKVDEANALVEEIARQSSAIEKNLYTATRDLIKEIESNLT